MNIGVILAAGTSSRFNHNIPKQLYPIDGKSCLDHSIEKFINLFEETIVVTNENYKIHDERITILTKNTKSRLESIKLAVDYIGCRNISNILLHDCARPFVPIEYFKKLIENSKTVQCSQYYLKLVNGLIKTDTWQVADRNKFIELCTPQIIDYKLFYYAFNKYIIGENRITCEILPLAKILDFKYELIEGNSQKLKKITTIEDLN